MSERRFHRTSLKQELTPNNIIMTRVNFCYGADELDFKAFDGKKALTLSSRDKRGEQQIGGYHCAAIPCLKMLEGTAREKKNAKGNYLRNGVQKMTEFQNVISVELSSD